MAFEFKATTTWWALPLLMAILGFLPTVTVGQAANSSTTNRTCYLCLTLYDGPLCQHVSSNKSLVTKMRTLHCPADEQNCIVKRYAYSNGTKTKVWMVERNCSKTCTDECLITGDKTKLHLCSSCCKTDLCNTDNGAPAMAIVAGYLGANVVVVAAVFLNCALQRMTSHAIILSL